MFITSFKEWNDNQYAYVKYLKSSFLNNKNKYNLIYYSPWKNPYSLFYCLLLSSPLKFWIIHPLKKLSASLAKCFGIEIQLIMNKLYFKVRKMSIMVLKFKVPWILYLISRKIHKENINLLSAIKEKKHNFLRWVLLLLDTLEINLIMNQ